MNSREFWDLLIKENERTGELELTILGTIVSATISALVSVITSIIVVSLVLK